jgi:two-component system cell cycle sensor histidine kinase/response regulator CckA
VLGGGGERIEVPFSTVLATIAPAHRDQLSRYEAEMSRGERESFASEFPVTAPTGGMRWQLATCQLVRDENGGPQTIVGAIADVTQQRALAEQLRQTQRLEAVGKLAGGVAHDFNNLLVAVSGFAEFALAHTRDVEGDDAKEVARHLASAVAGAQDGARLTRQLLAFSRRGVVAPSKVDLSAVIGDMRPLLARLFQGRLEVGLDLAYALPAVRGEPALITQFVLGILMQVRERATSATRASLRTFVVHEGGDRPHDAPNGEWVALEVAAAGIRSLVGVSFAGVDEVTDVGADALPAGELGLTVLASGFEAIGGRLVASSGEDGLVVRTFLAPWRG